MDDFREVGEIAEALTGRWAADARAELSERTRRLAERHPLYAQLAPAAACLSSAARAIRVPPPVAPRRDGRPPCEASARRPAINVPRRSRLNSSLSRRRGRHGGGSLAALLVALLVAAPPALATDMRHQVPSSPAYDTDRADDTLNVTYEACIPAGGAQTLQLQVRSTNFSTPVTANFEVTTEEGQPAVTITPATVQLEADSEQEFEVTVTFSPPVAHRLPDPARSGLGRSGGGRRGRHARAAGLREPHAAGHRVVAGLALPPLPPCPGAHAGGEPRAFVPANGRSSASRCPTGPALRRRAAWCGPRARASP